jgi:hypothetical protein
MSEPRLDVATVVDFRGENAAIYEGQALLFLASWQHNAGSSRLFPLHLACIGEPPQSVRRLAGQVGAHLHDVLPAGWRADHFVGNKVRGLEIPTVTDHVLLVDTDTVFLGDLADVARWRDCLAAGPDDHPKASLRQWRHIYQSLGEPLPELRGSCVIADYGLPTIPRAWQRYQVPKGELGRTVPYFNSGVVLVPASWRLAPAWAQAYRDITATFGDDADLRRSILHSDQAAFALVVERLRRQGRRIRTLPVIWHARWRHIYGGVPRIWQMKVLHLPTFLGTIRGRCLTCEQLRAAVRDYLGPKMTRRMARISAGHVLEGAPRLASQRFCQGRLQCRWLCAHLLGLCDQIVSPLLPPAAVRLAAPSQRRESAVPASVIGRPPRRAAG